MISSRKIIAIKTLNENFFNRIKPIILNNYSNIKFVDNVRSLIYDKKDSNILFYDKYLCQSKLKSYLEVTCDLQNKLQKPLVIPTMYSIIELDNSKNGKEIINISNEYIRMISNDMFNESNVIIPMDKVTDKQLLNEIMFTFGDEFLTMKSSL